MIGYARALSRGPGLTSQRDRLVAAGAAIVHEDLRAGGTVIRPALRNALDGLTAGGVLCVTSLDRLARAPRDLFTLAGEVAAKGAHLVALDDGVDTRHDVAFFRFAGILLAHDDRAAEDRRAEREILDAPRRAGPAPAINEAAWLTVSPLLRQGEITPVQAAERLGVSRATVYRRLRDSGG